MRLSTLSVTALPFVLLAAMLASVVAAPRLQSNITTESEPTTVYTVRNLPPVVVNAPASQAKNAISTQLVRELRNTSAASCAWMTGSLRMPYFSFATPRLSTNGI